MCPRHPFFAWGAALNPPDDSELASRVVQGDQGAFTMLVRRHERAVRSFLGRLAPGGRADDLSQETFVRAWEKASSFGGQGRYVGWLLGIAWTTFLLDARKVRRTNAISQQLKENPLPVLADDTDRRMAIQAAVERLSDQDRAAVLLCFGHGLTHEEAADALNVPLGTLKSRVARGREKLRELLEEHRP